MAKKEELIEQLFSKAEQLGISKEELFESFQEAYIARHVEARLQEDKQGIPFSVFNEPLSAQETVVKYLREEKKMAYGEIGQMLERSPGVIGVTYRRARDKHKKSLDTSSSHYIPLSIFNSKLSVLEHIVMHLRTQEMSFVDIGHILRRDPRTVWTAYSRALKKMGDGDA